MEAKTPPSVSVKEKSEIITPIEGPSLAILTPQTAPQKSVVMVIIQDLIGLMTESEDKYFVLNGSKELLKKSLCQLMAKS